jgi:hypothetical protein
MAQPVTKVPVTEENTYTQGKGQDAGAEVKVGPAYGGGLKSNPMKGGGINRSLKGGSSMGE